MGSSLEVMRGTPVFKKDPYSSAKQPGGFGRGTAQGAISRQQGLRGAIPHEPARSQGREALEKPESGLMRGTSATSQPELRKSS